jgi:hypothetical protein
VIHRCSIHRCSFDLQQTNEKNEPNHWLIFFATQTLHPNPSPAQRYKVVQNKTNAHTHCVKKYDMIDSFNQTERKFSAMQTTTIDGYTNINRGECK